MTDKVGEVLRAFKKELLKRWSKDIVEIRLFGSHARKKAHSDSDIDVLVVTKKQDWHVADSMHELAYQFLLKKGADLSIKTLSVDRFEELKNLHAPFIMDVLSESQLL